MAAKEFDGKHILIVEDEFFVGSDLEQILAADVWARRESAR